MKNFFTKSVFITALLLFTFLLRQTSFGQTSNKEEFDNEPEINLRSFIKNKAQSDLEKENFVEHFKFNTNDVEGPRDSLVIPMTEIRELYLKAEAAAQSQGLVKDEYITGLNIRHGAIINASGVEMNLIFETVYLDINRKAGKLVHGEFKSFAGKEIYSYDERNSRFEISNAGVSLNYTDAYEDRILIRKFKKRKFEAHTSGNEERWKDDVKGVVFSFQEIFDVYHGNYSERTTQNPNPIDPNYAYNQNLSLVNSSFSRKESGGWLTRERFIHTYIFSPLHTKFSPVKNKNVIDTEDKRLATISGLTVSGLGDSGNLGHMCPPSCVNLGDDASFPIK